MGEAWGASRSDQAPQFIFGGFAVNRLDKRATGNGDFERPNTPPITDAATVLASLGLLELRRDIQIVIGEQLSSAVRNGSRFSALSAEASYEALTDDAGQVARQGSGRHAQVTQRRHSSSHVTSV